MHALTNRTEMKRQFDVLTMETEIYREFDAWTKRKQFV